MPGPADVPRRLPARPRGDATTEPRDRSRYGINDPRCPAWPPALPRRDTQAAPRGQPGLEVRGEQLHRVRRDHQQGGLSGLHYEAVVGGDGLEGGVTKLGRKRPHAIGRKKQSIKPSLLYSMTTKYKYLLLLLQCYANRE